MDLQITSKNGRPITVRTDIHPGDISAIISLHGVLYAKEYGFNHTFEPYVAKPLSEFVLQQDDRNCLWIVEYEEIVMGAIAIVKHNDTIAQLRWFILHPDLRGEGIGRRLLEEAINFCETYGYKTVYLWTIDFLTAALKLYTSAGFKLTDTKTHHIWGRHLTEERYELTLQNH